MRVRGFRRIGDPHPLTAEDMAVVLIELDDGTAAVVACQHEPQGGLDGVTLAHANEADFNRVLHALGFSKMTICSSLGDLASTPQELERKLPLVISGRR